MQPPHEPPASGRFGPGQPPPGAPAGRELSSPLGDHQPSTPGRTLAPDLARGMMLLFIALANVSSYLYGAIPGFVGLHPVPMNLADKIWQGFLITVIDARSFPMFTFLFAYGMVQFYTSRRRRGIPDHPVRRMLLRRNLWLIGFGAVHVALLFAGDVLGSYGLAGLLLGWALFRRRDKLLVIWAAILFGLINVLPALITVGLGIAKGFASTSPRPTEGQSWLVQNIAGEAPYHWSVLWRLAMWCINVPLGTVLAGILPVMLLGWLAARHRLLEEAQRHRRLLVTVSLATIIPGWIIGAVQAMVQLQVIHPRDTGTFSTLSGTIGLGTGIGYACVFALLGSRWQQRPPALVQAIAAVGQRSLTFYLMQAMILAPLLSGWGLGLGRSFGTWQAMTLALGVWLLSVVLADVLRRRGARGPAEVLLRRLTYGKTEGAAPDGSGYGLPPGGAVMPWRPQWQPWMGWPPRPMAPTQGVVRGLPGQGVAPGLPGQSPPPSPGDRPTTPGQPPVPQPHQGFPPPPERR